MKQYVSVTAIFDEDGNLLPINIMWDDGRKFPIDKVTDVRFAASLKAGGAGIRYTCQIGGKERYLFLEDQRWFVDAKQPPKQISLKRLGN
ncbi:MAG: hypothetical protein ACI4RM_07460 [Ruminococcus sp.]